MARLFSGTSQYIDIGTAPALQLTGDFTWHAMIKTASASTDRLIMTCYGNVSPYSGWGIGYGIPTIGGRLSYWSSGSAIWRSSAGTINSGTWRACGVRIIGTGAGAGSFWIDGSTSGTFLQTAPGVYTGPKKIASALDNGSNFPGELAEIGIWSVGLEDREMVSLANGVSPSMIRTASLVAHWELIGRYSPELDSFKNRIEGTIVGTPSASDHPKIFLPDNESSYYAEPGGEPPVEIKAYWPIRSNTLLGGY